MKKTERTKVILTSNGSVDEHQQQMQEALQDAFKDRPGLARRFKTFEFKPMTEEMLGKIAGTMVGKKLGDRKLTKEQQEEIGSAVMELVTQQKDYNPDKGARGLDEAIDKLLAEPLPAEVEEKICANDSGYASRVSRRKGEKLADDCRTGVDVKPLKTLRLRVL